jgi:hypothetical protein
MTFFFCISLVYRTFELRSKVGCISEMKINRNLFCISLNLHYLCPHETGDDLCGGTWNPSETAD